MITTKRASGLVRDVKPEHDRVGSPVPISTTLLCSSIGAEGLDQHEDAGSSRANQVLNKSSGQHGRVFNWSFVFIIFL